VDWSEGATPADFFISRAGVDAPFAAEIGRILEDAGHRVVLQQWDFANRNFMERMHAALESGARVIALLSSEYLTSDHCAAEWQNAIAHDPLNKQGRLIVVRVAESKPTGLLTALAYWDLVPVRGDPALVRDIVLTAIKPGRHTDDGARAAQYWRGPRRAVLAGAAPGRAFRDQGDAELHRARERARGATGEALVWPDRRGDPTSRRARARRHRQVGARA
jgi:hypothetical protein